MGVKLKAFLQTFAICLLLSACGGGGSTPPTVQIEIPDDSKDPPMPACTDFRVRNAAGECSYDTPEFRANYASGQMGALHAYNNGYHGQGVTIAVAEIINASHEDLDANVLTFSVDYDWKWDRFATTPTVTYTGITLTTINGKVLDPPTESVFYHGTSGAGLIAAERNGLTAHGIAPQAKLIPLPNPSFIGQPPDSSLIEWLAQSTVHILSRSTFSDIISEHEQNAYHELADKDIVISQSLGNNPQETSQENPFWPTGLPTLNPELEDNLLVVGWITPDNEIAGLPTGTFGSTRCGNAMRWCVMAYGSGDFRRSLSLTTPSGPADNAYVDFSGTSASAPLVAGALALLKSYALQNTDMPMTKIRLILLETATPLYADASKNGVRMMENGEPVLSSVYGWGAVNVSAGITHLQGIANQMSAIKQMQVARLGGAAKLANGNKFAPANGEDAFRFWGGIETQNAWTGIATQEYGGVSGFAEYGKADMRIPSFLTNGEVRGAESQSWTAGMQIADLIRHNDNLRLSAREESRISDGELVLQYSFGKQIRIPIKQKPQTIWTLGYSQQTDNGKWSAAAEWNAATNESAFSAAVVVNL